MTKRKELHPALIPIILLVVAALAYPLSLLFNAGSFMSDGLQILASICGWIGISVVAIMLPIYLGVAAFRWNKALRQRTPEAVNERNRE